MSNQVPTYTHISSKPPSAPSAYQTCHDNVALLRSELKIMTEERDALQCEVERLQNRMDNVHSYDLMHSSMLKEFESLQRKHADLLDDYGKEKDNCDKMARELEDHIANEERYRSNEEACRHQLGDGLVHGKLLGDLMMHTSESEHRAQPHRDEHSLTEMSDVLELLRVENKQQKDEMLMQKLQCAALQQRVNELSQKANHDRMALHDKLGGAAVEKSRLELQLAMATAARSKDSRDLVRVRSERDAAVSEYQLVMSERDSVLREMEQLRSCVAELESKVKGVESEYKAAAEEAARARSEVETARKEASASVQASSALIDSAYSKEIDKMRKDLDKAQSELIDALQELGSSKQRCDWAFSERDKIVRECESTRIYCDQLRRERDSAVSELMSALRDSDDMRRQKNDATRELKELRDRYDVLLEKDMGSRPDLNNDGVCHHYSRDSAIDTELHDLDSEMLEVDLDNNLSSDFGFSLAAAGSQDLNASISNLVYVRSVQPASCAHGKLKPNDQIVRVNGRDVVDVSNAYHMLHNSTGLLHLTLRRKRPASCRVLIPLRVSLLKEDHNEKDLGIAIEQGHFVADIFAGSVAAQSDCLAVGDRVLAVNGMPVSDKSATEVRRLLNSGGDHVTLDVLRSQSTLMTPLSSVNGSSMAFRTPSSPVFPPGGTSEVPSPTVEDKERAFSQSSNAERLSQDVESIELNKSKGSLPDDDLDDSHRDSAVLEGGTSKRNFFDRAVSVIKRPFLRSRMNRVGRDSRSKSASYYTVSPKPLNTSGGSSDKITQFESTVAELQNESREKLHLSKAAPQDGSGHGTWPKYRTSGALRPTILPIDSIQLLLSGEDRQGLPVRKTPIRDSEVRRSESARNHRPQASDSVVDYVNIASLRNLRLERLETDTVKRSEDLEVGKSSKYVFTFPNQLAAKQAAPTSSKRGLQMSLTSRDDHLAVISHFPVTHATASQEFSFTRYSPGTLHRSMNTFTASQFQPSPEAALPPESRMKAASRASKVISASSSHSTNFCPTNHEFPTMAQPANSMLSSSARLAGHETDRNIGSIAGSSSVWGSIKGHPAALPVSVHCHQARNEASQYKKHTSSNAEFESEYEPFVVNKQPVPSLPTDDQLASSVVSQLATDRLGRIRIPFSRGQSPISSPLNPFSLATSSFNSLPHQARNNKDRLRRDKPHVGETRTINIELTSGGLGIDIDTSQKNGGVFVSRVDPQGVAASRSVMVGDQLLEVCGINMRNATKQLAESVLRQLAGSVSILLQYNPIKYYEGLNASAGGRSSASLSDESTYVTALRHSYHQPNSRLGAVIEQSMNQFQSRINSSSSFEYQPQPEPRLIECSKVHPNDPLGLDLVGGNMTGVFVRQILPNSPVGGRNGFRVGDQILQFNGVDFHGLTLEQSIIETRKPFTEMKCWARFNILQYNKTLVSLCGGDVIYLRAVRDHLVEQGTTDAVRGELSFKSGNILYVDNTAHGGCVGIWHAWLLDAYGNPTSTHGTLPSRVRMDDEPAIRRRSVCDVSEGPSGGLSSGFNKMAAGLRSSGSFRRSLFRRRRHRRSESRDDGSASSHLHPSPSDASLSSGCSSHTPEDGALASLERVEKLDCSRLRPVILIGPFADQLIVKLTLESPDKYFRYDSAHVLMAGNELASKHWLSTTLRDDLYIDHIKSISSRNRHCLMNASPEVVKRLNAARLFPIVIFMKHKSFKQIKEMKDVQFLPEKVSSKVAKDIFDQFQGYEQVYQDIFSDVIPGGNMAFVCCKIKSVIDIEQKKVVWVPTAGATHQTG